MLSLRKIFDEASEIRDREERDSFLISATQGNAVLLKQLHELLEAGERAGGFLGEIKHLRRTPSNDLTLSTEVVEGRYRILQKLGEGGCGVVYRAQQLEPVRREVALKVIKPGMDTRSVIARFEAERQALALMDHPNIARVFDAGATEAGRPFFAMELVRGTRITDYCDQHNYSTSERLHLFRQVCQAVQHAHQKGIIHRDIKPSNILVASEDGVALPKVIDFGIAKATTDQPLTDKTLFTQFEMLMGTPAYMSPEQAEYGATDIDTRTDIYSLGVLLYELLTGRTPFDSQTLLKSGIEVLRRTIREKQPIRPSTRLHSLSAEELQEVATLRKSEPVKLISLVRGDLDWIVLKALEKDRSRRYETANGLSADVQRYLVNEPVIARPPSPLYLFTKLVLRNKLAVLSGLFVCLALLLGSAMSLWQAVRARRAEHQQRTLRHEADVARELANTKAQESRHQLVRLNVYAGSTLWEQGDVFGALLPFTEALNLEEGDPAREDVHRRRFATVLRNSPRLAQVWFHDGALHSADFSRDGNLVVTTGSDQVVQVWNVNSGERAAPPMKSSPAIEYAWFLPDSRHLLAALEDGAVRVFDAISGQPSGPLIPAAVQSNPAGVASDYISWTKDGKRLLLRLPSGVQQFETETAEPVGSPFATDAVVRQVRFSEDGLQCVICGANPAVQVRNTQSGFPVLTLTNFDSIVRSAAFSPNGKCLAVISGYLQNDLSLWDIETGRALWPTIHQEGAIQECRVTPDGQRIVTINSPGNARVYDISTGVALGDPMHHKGELGFFSLSHDGRRMAVSSFAKFARVWDLGTGKPFSPILPHAEQVYIAQISRDGSRVVTGGLDGAARLWELRPHLQPRLTLRHRSSIKRSGFSSDGKKIFTCGADNLAQIWERETGQLCMRLEHPSALTDGCFAPDGKHFVTGCLDGSIHVWELTTGKGTGPDARQKQSIQEVRYNHDGTGFLTVSGDAARVWDGITAVSITPLLKHQKQILHAEFSPDGKLVVTASLDGTAQIWNATDGARIGVPMEHRCGVSWASFSPDSRLVVTSCSDYTIEPRNAQIWDAATGKPFGSPLPHTDGVSHAEFSPNGRFIATACEDRTASIWDASRMVRVTPRLHHESRVSWAQFSPNGRLLMTVCEDGTFRLWDSLTAEAVTPSLKPSSATYSVAWSPDSREFLTSHPDGTALVWDVSPAAGSVQQLRRQAELLSSHRLEPVLGAVPLSRDELKARWDEIQHR